MKVADLMSLLLTRFSPDDELWLDENEYDSPERIEEFVLENRFGKRVLVAIRTKFVDDDDPDSLENGDKFAVWDRESGELMDVVSDEAEARSRAGRLEGMCFGSCEAFLGIFGDRWIRPEVSWKKEGV